MQQDNNTEKLERIAKIIANRGFCSRRDAERLIAEGKVHCNGHIVEHPNFKTHIDAKIAIEGQEVVQSSKSQIWIYYKPRGLVTTHKDPENRPTVFDSLPKHLPRVISAGRLDINSEGLLILTNNPEIARYFESPKNKVKRIYKVRVFGNIDDRQMEKLKYGITIDGIKYGNIEYKRIQKDSKVSDTSKNTWITLTLCEGKNREIRNILSHFGLGISRLIRIEYGDFTIGELKPGELYKVHDVIVDRLLKKIHHEI